MQNTMMKLDVNGLHFFKQRKSHKKKRINKKWAKRYGYKKISTLPQDFYKSQYVKSSKKEVDNNEG